MQSLNRSLLYLKLICVVATVLLILYVSGKNDGTVQGIRYFTCKPKHGMFVRADKLILDRRGRAMRTYKAEALANSKKLSSSRGNNAT